MKRSRPKLGFRNKSVTDQIAIARGLARGGGQLPAPTRTAIYLDELDQAIDDTTAAQNLVSALRSELKAAVVAMHRQAGRMRQKAERTMLAYSGLAVGDSDFLAVGLRLEKKRVPVGIPGVPLDVRAETSGYTGAVRVRLRRPVRRCAFVVEYALDASPGEWKHARSAVRTRFDVRELPPATPVWLRVAAVNVHGQGPWSDPVRALSGM